MYLQKHDIASAIYTVKLASTIGYKALEAFTLTREKPHILNSKEDDEPYEEFVERLSYACWMGRDYFKMWLGDENRMMENNIMNNLNINYLDNGVYYMEFLGEESHYWVWIIDNDDLWYAGTYGGVCDLVVKKFNKIMYASKFIDAMYGYLDDYAFVFQIKNPEITRVKYKYVKYMKSDRY